MTSDRNSEAENVNLDQVGIGAQPVVDHPAAEGPPSAARKHGSCLTAFLLLAIFSNLLFTFTTYSRLVPQVPSSLQPYTILAAALNLAAIVFVVAIFAWKKWGVYGYLASVGITTIINLYFGDTLSFIRGIVPIVLLVILVRPLWPQMD